MTTPERIRIVLPSGWLSRQVSLRVVRVRHLWQLRAVDQNGATFDVYIDEAYVGPTKRKGDSVALLESLGDVGPIWLQSDRGRQPIEELRA